MMKFIIFMSIFVCVLAQTCAKTKILHTSRGYGTLNCNPKAQYMCAKMANVQCIGHAKPFDERIKTGYSYDWECFNIPSDQFLFPWYFLNIEGPEHDVLSITISPENMLMDFILILILILIEAVIHYYAPRHIRNGLILLDFISIIILILSDKATLSINIVS